MTSLLHYQMFTFTSQTPGCNYWIWLLTYFGNILWQFSKISYAFSNGVNVPYLVLITSFFMTFYFNVGFVGLSYFGIFIPVCVQLIYSYIINCKLTSLPRTLRWCMISYSLNIFLVFTQLDFLLLTAVVAISPLRVNKLIQ